MIYYFHVGAERSFIGAILDIIWCFFSYGGGPDPMMDLRKGKGKDMKGKGKKGKSMAPGEGEEGMKLYIDEMPYPRRRNVFVGSKTTIYR